MIEIDHNPADKPAIAAPPHEPTPPRPAGRRRIGVAAIAAIVAAFAVGAGLSALVTARRPATLVALAPAPIKAMQDWSPVAIKGQVAEIYGNTFILQDDSGRALVETGPRGDGGRLVATSETVTVQGRFERGIVHAEAIVHPDGHADLVGPPHRGPLAWSDGPRAHWLGGLWHRDG